MTLEREDIERRDFPIGRRGYEPEAVDAHLSSLADQIEQLKTSSRQRTEPVSVAASEQVRQILEAAEDSAADIQRQAEDEAREIEAQAAAEAQATRERATAQAREYVSKVSESTAVMLQRLDAMESELGATLQTLRTSAQRLESDLGLLDVNLLEVREAASVTPRAEPEPEREAAPLPAASAGEAGRGGAGAAPEAEAEPPGAEIAAADLRGVGTAAVADPGDEPDAAEVLVAEGTVEDAEGARLIALNMALNGTPREETDRYLADNFKLSNRSTLLDEVYASVDG